MNGTSVSSAATTTTSTTSTTARRWSIVVLVTSWSLAGLAIALVPFTEPTWHLGQWYGLVDTADAIVFGAVAYALLARAVTRCRGWWHCVPSAAAWRPSASSGRCW